MKRTLTLLITAISMAWAVGAPPEKSLKQDDTQSAQMVVGKKYLLIPIRVGEDECTVEFEVAGQKVMRCGAELAPDAGSVDFWAYFSIEAHQGKSAVISAEGAKAESFALIRQADELPGQDTLYSEALRPQLRFSQKAGWNNDVNGLVYHEGEWHLYYPRVAGGAVGLLRGRRRTT